MIPGIRNEFKFESCGETKETRYSAEGRVAENGTMRHFKCDKPTNIQFNNYIAKSKKDRQLDSDWHG